jgi:hypothetical protein
MKDTDNDDVAYLPLNSKLEANSLPDDARERRPALSVMTKARPMHAHPELFL